MAQTAVEAWIEEGMAKGLEKGRLLALREALCKVLERHFGPLPESLRERIHALNDLALLQTAFDQAIGLERLEDLQL